MYKLYEACIIHSIHDSVFSTFFEKFMKWIGIYCFNFTYHDDNAELNDVLKKDYFDFVLYINDKNDNWKNQYARISDVHVNINTNDYNNSIWCSINDSTDEKTLNRNILIKAFENVIQNDSSDSEDLRLLFNFLAEIFCKHNILHKILTDETNYNLLFYDMSFTQFLKEVAGLSHGWDKIIAEMETHKNNFENTPGLGNYVYALVYSKFISMKLHEILRWKSPYTTDMLLKEVDSIYTYNILYMGEFLKANIASLEPNHELNTIFYMGNCLELCHANVCSSFLYYKMGTFYDLLDRPDDAILCYTKAYKKNPFNFYALFKIATFKKATEHFNEAETTLKLILKILQVYGINDEFNEDTVKHLPLLEMEYACRCFLFWESITHKQAISKITGKLLYQNACKICNLVKQSDYLKCMYENDYKNIQAKVESMISNGLIQKDLRNKLNF